MVGLATLISETGHVPLLHRTYPGNGSDQTVLSSCLDALGKLHDVLDDAEQRSRPAFRTLVRDGGSWSEQLELDLGCGWLLYVDLSAFEPSGITVGTGTRCATRGDEVGGRETGRRAGRAIAYLGAQAGSCMLSAGSGTWRNSSGGPRRAGSRHGALLISGPTTPCDYTPSRR